MRKSDMVLTTLCFVIPGGLIVFGLYHLFTRRCQHEHYGFPVKTKKDGKNYVFCQDCGSQVEYDWIAMRIVKEKSWYAKLISRSTTRNVGLGDSVAEAQERFR